ncbi:MAG: PD-(D/E)XK nuclease family protein, partial [Acidimicrobiia bacterium]|nr:PD-(D/E)XK nuclease family protein [Acidimicrobiia bacterium]
DRHRAIRRVLLGPLFGRTVGALRALESRLVSSATGWVGVLADEPNCEPLAALIEDPAWADKLPAAKGFWHLWTALPQFADLVGDPVRRDERGAWASLAQVIGRFGERNPKESLASYVKLADTEEFEAQPLLEYRDRGDRLTVTTLHQAKGLDLSVVFIADAVSGVLPDLRLRDSLLETRHLSPWQGTTTAAQRRFRMQEETRLVYTAMTRASRKVVFTATTTTAALGPIGPSPFLDTIEKYQSAAEEDEAALWFEPLSSADAEARLRRIAGSIDEPGTRRRAAVRVLAEAPGSMRSPKQFAVTRQPGPDTGIVPDGHKLSASQASNYEACPRRYVLEYHLRIGDDTTVHMRFGTLVHDVLEAVEKTAVDEGRGRSTLQEALLELADQFEPDLFGGPPWADAWLRRAEKTLNQMYDRWPPGGWEGIDFETAFAIDRVDATWRGRIDRIERRGDDLRVVDYKTSTNVPTRDEAGQSLQLGLYVMAVDELDIDGTVAAAELWFPTAKPNQNSIQTRSLDLGNLDGIEDRLEAVAVGIRNEDWPAIPNDRCDRCRMISLCPAWPDGREAFT